MKKLFVLFALCAIALSGCTSDSVCKDEYVLKNDSSHEIAITVAPGSSENAKSLTLAQGESATWFKRTTIAGLGYIGFAYTVTYDGSVSIEYNGKAHEPQGLMSVRSNWQDESIATGKDSSEVRITYIFTDAEYEAVLALQENQ